MWFASVPFFFPSFFFLPFLFKTLDLKSRGPTSCHFSVHDAFIIDPCEAPFLWRKSGHPHALDRSLSFLIGHHFNVYHFIGMCSCKECVLSVYMCFHLCERHVTRLVLCQRLGFLTLHMHVHMGRSVLRFFPKLSFPSWGERRWISHQWADVSQAQRRGGIRILPSGSPVPTITFRCWCRSSGCPQTPGGLRVSIGQTAVPPTLSS